MPRKKTDKETGATVLEAVIETADTIFEENDTNANENITPDYEEKSDEFIVLKKGGSYHFGDLKFIKNEPVPVDTEIAEKLMKTGFFERSES